MCSFTWALGIDAAINLFAPRLIILLLPLGIYTDQDPTPFVKSIA